MIPKNIKFKANNAVLILDSLFASYTEPYTCYTSGNIDFYIPPNILDFSSKLNTIKSSISNKLSKNPDKTFERCQLCFNPSKKPIILKNILNLYMEPTFLRKHKLFLSEFLSKILKKSNNCFRNFLPLIL